jgi:hypothetical protein
MLRNGKHGTVSRKIGFTILVDEYHKIHWVFIVRKRWFSKTRLLEVASLSAFD